jgi:hypothetical protein
MKKEKNFFLTFLQTLFDLHLQQAMEQWQPIALYIHTTTIIATHNCSSPYHQQATHPTLGRSLGFLPHLGVYVMEQDIHLCTIVHALLQIVSAVH